MPVNNALVVFRPSQPKPHPFPFSFSPHLLCLLCDALSTFSITQFATLVLYSALFTSTIPKSCLVSPPKSAMARLLMDIINHAVHTLRYLLGRKTTARRQYQQQQHYHHHQPPPSLFAWFITINLILTLPVLAAYFTATHIAAFLTHPRSSSAAIVTITTTTTTTLAPPSQITIVGLSSDSSIVFRLEPRDGVLKEACKIHYEFLVHSGASCLGLPATALNLYTALDLQPPSSPSHRSSSSSGHRNEQQRQQGGSGGGDEPPLFFAHLGRALQNEETIHGPDKGQCRVLERAALLLAATEAREIYEHEFHHIIRLTSGGDGHGTKNEEDALLLWELRTSLDQLCCETCRGEDERQEQMGSNNNDKKSDDVSSVDAERIDLTSENNKAMQEGQDVDEALCCWYPAELI